MAPAPEENALPPSLRFLKALVIVLMLSMILGVITVTGLLVTRLRAPLAPSLAAAKEGNRIIFGDLLEAAQTLSERHGYLLIEGAGGLMVPLSGAVLLLDLVKALGHPLLTVCRPTLGTINHTLLTMHAARSNDIPLAGYIVNNMPQTPNEAEAQAPNALVEVASGDLLAVLGQVAGTPREQAQALADQLERVPTLHWLLSGLNV